MSLLNLEDHLRTSLRALAAQGYKTDELIFEPPAQEAEIRMVEATIGVALPPIFREMLTSVSAHVDFSWFAPDGLEYPPPFRSNFCGELSWSLNGLVQMDADRRRWIETCFPDPHNKYDRVWHDKLAFQEVGNGDLIVIDLRPENQERIVYLSHDGGEGHGMVLAPSFPEFVERWALLACAGGEDWQWLPFHDTKKGGLDPDGDNAKTWRALLKMDVYAS